VHPAQFWSRSLDKTRNLIDITDVRGSHLRVIHNLSPMVRFCPPWAIVGKRDGKLPTMQIKPRFGGVFVYPYPVIASERDAIQLMPDASLPALPAVPPDDSP